MKEHPILMSGPMVRAILEGQKTQTRRVMNPQPSHDQYHVWRGKVTRDAENRMWCWKDLVLDNIWDFPKGEDRKTLASHCPYGIPGDRLWVREPWTSGYQDGAWGTICRVDSAFLYGKRQHEKGPHFHAKEIGPHIRWRPSIHMPRWASRITLEITDVRVQRLQDISATDCEAEGIRVLEGKRVCHAGETKMDDAIYVVAYAKLWNSINGKTHSWYSNPFVWAISFKRVQP